MGKKVTLSEAQLKKIIKESVLGEISREKVMPHKFWEVFKNRVVNAIYCGDVEKTVREFYKQFVDRIDREDFTLDNLMELAEKIEDGEGGGGHGNPGAHRQGMADRWWGVNAGKELEESRKPVRLNESQLKKVIAESVKKVLNEISSDMISRASAKLYGKYGWNGTERDKLEKDEHGNPLHPKDKKPMAQHFKNFQDAFERAKRDEQMNDPVTKEAMEIWNECEGDVDWEVTDDFENEGVELGGTLEVDGWKFGASAYGHYAGGLEVDEVYEVEFESPDGEEGSFRP